MAKSKAPKDIRTDEEKQIDRIYISAICSDAYPTMRSEDSEKVTELYEELKELRKLKELINNNKPVCPYCKKEMIPVNYKGYYDSFPYWECECDKFEGKDVELYKGRYA